MRWRKVNSLLPMDGDMCLVWNGKNIAISKYSKKDGFDTDLLDMLINEIKYDGRTPVTHWMPLPLKPNYQNTI